MWDDITFTRWIIGYSMFIMQKNSRSIRFGDELVLILKVLFELVFHGTQSTVHVNFQNGQEERKISGNNEAVEGTLVRLISRG
jgi:hypothetical protein